MGAGCSRDFCVAPVYTARRWPSFYRWLPFGPRHGLRLERKTKNNMQQLLLLLLVTLLQTVEAQSRGPFFGASISGFIISMLVLGSFLLLGIYVCACLKKPAQIEVSQPDA